MRIAYLTTDEVNHDVAQRSADDCGATLEVPALAEPIPDGAYDAILVDWDYLPVDCRRPILAALRIGRPHGRAVVHGYHLEDDVRHTLGQSGVAVHRRLEPKWLARWLRRLDRTTGSRRPRKTADSPA